MIMMRHLILWLGAIAVTLGLSPSELWSGEQQTPVTLSAVVAPPTGHADAVVPSVADSFREDGPRCDYVAGVCDDSCLPAARLWVSAEYLAWWSKAMHTPPLITQAERGNPAIIGSGGEVIYGGDGVLDTIRQGGRLRAGYWWDGCQGIEGEYFALANVSDCAIEGCNGSGRTVARPFVNAQTGLPSTELVCYLPPVNTSFAGSGALCGAVSVDASSDFSGAGMRYRHWWTGQDDACGNGWQLDWLAGYRYLSLNEHLNISEHLTSLDPNRPFVAFDILDQFGTSNEFHGGDLGFAWTGHRECWSLELLSKVALGANRRRVAVNGVTTITNTFTGQSRTSTVAVPADGAGTGAYTGGGLLAQRPNIGTRTDDAFGVVPEVGITLGYQVSRHVKTTLGYSLIVWTGVARPGDQIDPYVNPDLLPDEVTPVTGPLRPAALANDTTFWAQGLNAGVQIDF